MDGIKVVDLHKQGRQARKHEVEVSIGNADKEVADGADGRERKHLKRAHNSTAKVLLGRKTRRELRPKHLVARFLAEALRLAVQQHGSVRLARKEEEDYGNDAADDGDDPEDPAPAELVGDDAADDGADDGA